MDAQTIVVGLIVLGAAAERVRGDARKYTEYD